MTMGGVDEKDRGICSEGQHQGENNESSALCIVICLWYERWRSLTRSRIIDGELQRQFHAFIQRYGKSQAGRRTTGDNQRRKRCDQGNREIDFQLEHQWMHRGISHDREVSEWQAHHEKHFQGW